MAIIKTKNLGKQYLLKLQQNRVKLLFSPCLINRYFWAVKRINVEIEKGDICWIIGDNGSGKTTLLKLFSGLIQPTRGFVYVEGKIVQLIDLDSGLYPDLSAKENMYLYGYILDMHKEEIIENIDKASRFSELSNYMDEPLRMFSDGMRLRLIYSLAIFMSADIYIFDEILAVGDIGFREKCINILLKHINSGKTIIYTNHNLKVFDKLKPSKIIWLEKGRIKKVGDRSLIEEYKRKSTDLFDTRNLIV